MNGWLVDEMDGWLDQSIDSENWDKTKILDQPGDLAFMHRPKEIRSHFLKTQNDGILLTKCPRPVVLGPFL